jgi:hypothetical protein
MSAFDSALLIKDRLQRVKDLNGLVEYLDAERRRIAIEHVIDSIDAFQYDEERREALAGIAAFARILDGATSHQLCLRAIAKLRGTGRSSINENFILSLADIGYAADESIRWKAAESMRKTSMWWP